MAEEDVVTGAMYCTHCGRPAHVVLWMNGFAYHEECLAGKRPPQPTPAEKREPHELIYRPT